MKLRIDIEKVSCEIELTPTNDGSGNEIITSESLISGEVYLTESGLTMNLVSDDDRRLLSNCLRDGVTDFVLKMTGYSIVED